jgi:peptidoglycan/xylan/chitin deacetylase (PgdA/CDA1 family)
LAFFVSGCGGAVVPESHPTGTVSPVTSSTENLPPTVRPTLTLAPIPILTPEPTAIPTPRPTASPNIICDQRLVPDAQAVPPVAKEPAKSFALHVPILEYHLITTFKPSSRIVETDGVAAMPHLVVPPTVFDAQMKILHDNGWRTITLAKLANDLDNSIAPPPKTFVVGFDDGYVDGYKNAWPILEKYGFVATFFVISSRVNRPANLTAPELSELAQAGNEIADHTVDHVRVTSGKADYEVDAAAQYIAQVTGQWPSTFAYPFGSVNSSAEKAVARCQPMRMAVIEGNPSDPVDENWSNRFAVPRLEIGPGTSAKYLLQVLSRYAKEKAA